jgi:hypothetical protein
VSTRGVPWRLCIAENSSGLRTPIANTSLRALPQPHAWPLAVLLDEDHAGRFEGGADGGAAEMKVAGGHPANRSTIIPEGIATVRSLFEHNCDPDPRANGNLGSAQVGASCIDWRRRCRQDAGRFEGGSSGRLRYSSTSSSVQLQTQRCAIAGLTAPPPRLLRFTRNPGMFTRNPGMRDTRLENRKPISRPTPSALSESYPATATR